MLVELARVLSRVGQRPGLVLVVAVWPTLGARAQTPPEAPQLLRLELYFRPAAELQTALWLQDAKGRHIQDIFVTQATGSLGIGNRPGRPDFLSSWRAPYGARPSVLPVWAHRRQVRYPKIIFHDPSNHNSLGYHEGTSSAEPYFCRPLSPEEQHNIIDTMTCPSPQIFQTDKGRIDPSGESSVYPPRNDLRSFEDGADHPDTRSFDKLNDLDSVSGATPPKEVLHRIALRIPVAQLIDQGFVPPFEAWIEVNRENDQNEHYRYERESHHWVDPRLPDYGVPYYGQPAVSYRLQFDPMVSGDYLTQQYQGYADPSGQTGQLVAPDTTISQNPGSGAGRLLDFPIFGQAARFALRANKSVLSDNSDCAEQELPPVQALEAKALDFDRVELFFRVPRSAEDGFLIGRLRARYQHSTPMAQFDLSKAVEASSVPPMCHLGWDERCMSMEPGQTQSVTVDSLWGDYTYTFSVEYEDLCGTKSPPQTVELTTPKQRFTQIDSHCFVATAAYGASWVHKVWALRQFRDSVLKPSPLGRDLVRFYYGYGPALARIVAWHPFLQARARDLLQPLANAALIAARHPREHPASIQATPKTPE